MKRVILFVGLVLLLGCVQRNEIKTGGVVNDGMKIEVFNAMPDKIAGNELTIVSLVMQNVGNQTARNVMAQLLNTGLMSVESDSTVKIGEMDLDAKEILQWELKAPDVKNVEYMPIARICFDYTNAGYVNAKIVDYAVYNKDTVIPPIISGSNSGPVQFSFEIDGALVVPAKGGVKSFVINILNVGNGQLSTESGKENFGELDKVGPGDLKVIIPKLEGRVLGMKNEGWTCRDYEIDSNEWACENENVISLVKGRTVRVEPEIEFAGYDEQYSLDLVGTIDIVVDYKYCILTSSLKIMITD